MAQDNGAIDIGVEHESDVDADADLYAYNDDGEHATVFAITRTMDTEVEIEYFRSEAGLSDSDGKETFDIDADKTTEQFAGEVAESDPQFALEIARNYWKNK